VQDQPHFQAVSIMFTTGTGTGRLEFPYQPNKNINEWATWTMDKVQKDSLAHDAIDSIAKGN